MLCHSVVDTKTRLLNKKKFKMFYSPINIWVSGFLTKICIKMILNYVIKDITELGRKRIHVLMYCTHVQPFTFPSRTLAERWRRWRHMFLSLARLSVCEGRRKSNGDAVPPRAHTAHRSHNAHCKSHYCPHTLVQPQYDACWCRGREREIVRARSRVSSRASAPLHKQHAVNTHAFMSDWQVSGSSVLYTWMHGC